MRYYLKKQILFILASLFLLTHVQAEMKILAPDDFITWIQGRQGYLNTYSIAEFGYVPYGRTFIGHVEIPEIADGCSDYTLKFEDEWDRHPIVMVNRGNCHFVQKARFAQLAGAKLLMVVDTRLDDDLNTVSLRDDGQGII